MVRTGYENVIANRTGEMFAYTAKKPGKVIAINEFGITVEYEDGSKKGVTLGKVHGKAEGSVYPFNIVSPLKLNDVFKKGDVVAYNDGYFEPDYYDSKNIIMKSSMTVKTVLLESNETLEDSCSISKDISDSLTTTVTHIRQIIVNFDQNIHNVVKVGSNVSYKDKLLVIEDEITSKTDYFDQASIDLLSNLAQQAPSAKYSGVIDRIEVFYNGDKEDMSESLRNIVEQSDKYLMLRSKASNTPIVTGKVTSDYNASGTPLTANKAEIRIYISVRENASAADKVMFGLQLKSIIGEVMNYKMFTESGDEIKAKFGYRSIAARIVLSPAKIGTTTTLLKVIAKKAVEL